MAKGIVGGMTDYNHQSLSDILNDIEEERKRAISFKNTIQKNVGILTANSYWTNSVPFDFKNIITYALKHYDTSITELENLKQDINREVKENHVKRLIKISNVAQEINVDIGKIWNQQYNNKQYDNADFQIVERIYADTRDMAVNLLDTSNIAERLDDYIGNKNPNMTKNNPWISGSFYLTVTIITITGLAVLSNSVHWTLFPVIIMCGILLIGIIGFLQLKNDDKITDKAFVSLVVETYKRLPLLRQKNK